MGIYLDLGIPLSYNKLFTFIVSNRGAGKTYGAKQWAIKDFLKNGKQFIYLRRYKTELKEAGKFFDDIASSFPDHTFKVSGRKFLIDGKEAGLGIQLSNSLNQKSTPFPRVNKIIFDEFIILKGSIHYLPTEVETFLEFYSTVARLREGKLSDDVRVLFLGNNMGVVNPYFQYFRIKPDQTKSFNVYDDILVHFYTNQGFIEKMSETRFGKLIAGTDYFDYAILNKSLTDNADYIQPRSPDSLFLFAVDYENKTVGLWKDYKTGILTVSHKTDPSTSFHYCVKTKDARPNISLIKNARRSYHLKQLIKAYEDGALRYEDLYSKSTAIDILMTVL